MKRRDAWKTPSFWRDVIEILAFFLMVALVLWLFIKFIVFVVESFRSDGMDQAEVTEVSEEDGVGRATSYLDGVYAPEVQSVCLEDVPCVEVYVEGEGAAPAWYRPEEEMAVEWEAHPPVGISPGGIDYNICSTVWGWEGHGMEQWEFDLFVRISYLEFWGTSRECCEAGIDSILLLWNMGEYGKTMGELLSAQYAPGYYVYSPYAYVWSWDYDAQGLEEIREMCAERFQNGPTWCAPYFRMWYYHDTTWSTPAYTIDNVYFSVPKGE